MKIIEQLVASIREASEYNQNTQAAPAAILWTDKEKQWESAIPLLLEQMPELMVFGDYAPEQRTGPAIWLKCALENTLETQVITDDETPIIYLPGVSRIDIRAIESCPEALQPLAELQYRGALWSQSNGRDWTIFAWLKTSNSIPQFLIQKYRLIYLDKIEYLVIKGAGRKGQSTTTAPESSPARLY